MYPNQNGRVVNLNKNYGSDFKLTNATENTNYYESLAGIQELSPLSIKYFSKENLDYIQNKLVSEIYRRSNGSYKISRQSDTEMKIVMKGIYLEYSSNNLNDINGEINRLNTLVLNYAIKNTMTAIEQHIKYKKDVMYLPVTIERPKNMSEKGSRVLPCWLTK